MTHVKVKNMKSPTLKQFANQFLVSSALSFRGPKRMLFQEVLVTANSCCLGSCWEDDDFQ